MFGATTEFFFRHVLGIQQSPGTRGFSSIVFRPSVLLSTQYLKVCSSLKSVNGTLRRPHGDIHAGWVCDAGASGADTSGAGGGGGGGGGGGVAYNVGTPVGVDAVVYFPLAAKDATTAIFEGGKKVWDGATFVGSAIPGLEGAAVSLDGNSIIIRIKSGGYAFSSLG